MARSGVNGLTCACAGAFHLPPPTTTPSPDPFSFLVQPPPVPGADPDAMPGKRETKNYTPETADVEGLINDPFPYFCFHCSEWAIILDTALERLPRRKTDCAFVIPNTGKHLLKNNMAEGGCKMLKREKGTERLYRWLCRGCRLVIA